MERSTLEQKNTYCVLQTVKNGTQATTYPHLVPATLKSRALPLRAHPSGETSDPGIYERDARDRFPTGAEGLRANRGCEPDPQ